MTASCSALFTERDAHNFRIFNGWMTAGAIVFSAATILLRKDLIVPAAGWGLTILAVALMIVTVQKYVLFLRNADELLRKIHLDALALAFGVGAVVMMGYRLCERLGAPQLDINDPLLVMLLTWLIGQWLGTRRYGAGAEE